MAWVLTRGMTNLRNQINEVGPNRDKASDGTIGNDIHAATTSGHNPDLTGSAEYKDGDSKDEVRAIDIDNSGPWLSGVTAEKIVQHLVEKGRSGNLETQIRYIIYNRRIWTASNNWATQTYTGASDHTEHIHFSGAYNQAADENTTYNYGLESLVTDMPLDSTDHAGIRNDAMLGAGYDVGAAFVRATTGDPADATPTDRGIRNGWDAGMSFAIGVEYNAIMSAIQQVLAATLADDGQAAQIIQAINTARDAEISAAVQGFNDAHQDMLALGSQVASVDEAVIAKLGNPSTPDQEVADVLTQLLGDRKDAVLALMD